MGDVTERVIEIVESVPPGYVTTYGAIARAAGTGARVVGRVLHHGGHDIPWWRVVDAEGRPYEGAVDEVRARFHEESTPLLRGDAELVVDLAKAAWDLGPGHRRAQTVHDDRSPIQGRPASSS